MPGVNFENNLFLTHRTNMCPVPQINWVVWKLILKQGNTVQQ
jgi:hypothetical protein